MAELDYTYRMHPQWIMQGYDK